jgi:hypothetical protein
LFLPSLTFLEYFLSFSIPLYVLSFLPIVTPPSYSLFHLPSFYSLVSFLCSLFPSLCSLLLFPLFLTSFSLFPFFLFCHLSCQLFNPTSFVESFRSLDSVSVIPLIPGPLSFLKSPFDFFGAPTLFFLVTILVKFKKILKQ